ncbi:MAG TPA: aminoacyl-tRNA hydrolase [Candidatus Paceibacterota bacterium]|nr:aminoacyl-tRNA hydrolase [Candidatus Paceibacterota bacterium]
MQWTLAGLGNPGDEYVGTRHNVGREMLAAIEKKENTKGKLFGKKVTLLYPNVYMNNSGGPIKKTVTSKKAAETLVVVHDELDLPLGKIKISFGSSAGGHNGVKSVGQALKTMDFVRVRIGISGSTPAGKLKRPAPEKIVDFVLGKFKPADKDKLKKVQKEVSEALEILLTDGLPAAMTYANTR